MSLSKLRPMIAASCIALTLALPTESQACWLTSCFSHPAPACPAPVAQQVNYVPQTCYRTVYSPVALTSYRPITSTDPCTGCPVTSMAPVTTYVQRPVVVPYTTYRPVVTTVLMPMAPACSTCSPCATGACGVVPATTYYAPGAVAAPAPSCGCGASAVAGPTGVQTASYYAPATTGYYGASTTSYYAPRTSGPAVTYYSPTSPSYTTSPSSVATGAPTTTYYNGSPSNASPGPVYFTSPSNGNGGLSTGVPTLPNSPNSGSPSNAGATQVQKPADNNPPPEVPVKPIPDTKDPAKGSSTGIFQNEPSGRTTGMPTMRPWSYTTVNGPRVTTVSTVQPAAQPAPLAADADGWHAAR